MMSDYFPNSRKLRFLKDEQFLHLSTSPPMSALSVRNLMTRPPFGRILLTQVLAGNETLRPRTAAVIFRCRSPRPLRSSGIITE